MPKLPRKREIERVLIRLGFVLARHGARHDIFKNKSGRRIPMPRHGSKMLTHGVFYSILDELGLTEEEFWKIK
jgi:predicted RNA binding protein YcfA (HicA-like mRNA interferase family)